MKRMRKCIFVWLCVCLVFSAVFASAEDELHAVNVVVLEIEGSV